MTIHEHLLATPCPVCGVPPLPSRVSGETPEGPSVPSVVILPVALIGELADRILAELFYAALGLATEDSPASYDETLRALAREIQDRGPRTYTDATLADAADMLSA